MYRNTLIGCGLLLVQWMMGHPVAAQSGVHGRVFGQPAEASRSRDVVGGARIEFLGPTGSVAAETSSSETGYFSVTLPPGNYRYRVRAEGYKDQTGDRGIAIRNSESMAVYNITLKPVEQDAPPTDDHATPPENTSSPGTVYGKVFYTDSNGQTPGIAGAEVNFGGPGSLLLLSRVSTSGADASTGRGEGFYTISLEPGTYTVAAGADGFHSAGTPQTIEVTAGMPHEHDLELVPAIAEQPTQGIVASVRLADPSLESDPRGVSSSIPDIELLVVNLANPAAAFKPSENDSSLWRMPLAPGRYRVLAFATGYARAISPAIDVLKGQFSRVDLTLIPTASEPSTPTTPPEPNQSQGIAGRIEIEPPLTDTSEFSVLMHQVAVQIGSLEAARSQKLVVDAFGNFRADLDAGPYRVVASLTGYQPDGAAVTVSAGQHSEIVLTLRRKGASQPQQTLTPVEVEVRELTESRRPSRPIQGATVVVRPADPSSITSLRSDTDGDGIARFRLAPRLLHRVAAGKPGFASKSGTLTPSVGAPNRLTLLLDATGPNPSVDPTPEVRPGGDETMPIAPTLPDAAVALRVRVWQAGTDQNRPRPLYGAEVALLHKNFVAERQRSDEQGTVALKVPPGDYQLVTRLAGFDSDESMIRLTKPFTSLDIFLKREAPRAPTRPAVPEPPTRPLRSAVNLQVGGVSDDGSKVVQLLAGVRVTLRGLREITPPLMTDGRGIVATELPSGTYQVIFEKAGYQSKTESLTVTHQPIHHRVLMFASPAAGRPDRSPGDTTSQLTVQVGGVSPSSGNQVSLLKNARVSISNNGRQVANGTTDANGVFTAAIQPGTLQLQVSSPGYQTRSERLILGQSSINHRMLLYKTPSSPDSTSRPPIIIPDAKMLEINQPTLTIQVGGKDPGGGNQVNLVSNASVQIRQNGQSMARGSSNPSGVFATKLPVGDYEILVTHPKHYDKRSTVRLTNQSQTLRILMDPKRTIQ